MSKSQKLNNKTSSFPIACILFFIGVVFFVISSFLNSYAVIDVLGALKGGNLGSSLLISMPLFLLAFSSTNTSKKPSILFLIVLFIQTGLSSLGIIGSIVTCVTNFQYNFVYGIANCISAIAIILLTIGYLCVFVFSLIIKILKKTSKLCKFWFLFPSVLVLGYITAIAGKIATLILSVKDMFGYPEFIAISIVAAIFFALAYIIFIPAFFAVCYHFAKINKNLSLPEDSEITE
jgi:hypothetical protein